MTKAAERISTQDEWHVRGGAAANSYFVVVDTPSTHGDRSERLKAATDAVYAYLQAVRSLGKRRVSSADVASALDLSERDVRKIMAAMTDRGVRPG